MSVQLAFNLPDRELRSKILKLHCKKVEAKYCGLDCSTLSCYRISEQTTGQSVSDLKKLADDAVRISIFKHHMSSKAAGERQNEKFSQQKQLKDEHFLEALS